MTGMAEQLHIGDRVSFRDIECVILVQDVVDVQPLKDDGIIFFIDQYGEQKMAAHDGDKWEIVIDDELTEEQEDRAFDLLW